MLILISLPAEIKHVPDAPTGLMVEFIREPESVPILDLKPEFSWILPANANYQKGYQILVSSTKEKLESGIANIWDSKKIRSNRSTEIELEGNDLAEKTNYFWKVRIWNDKDKPSEYSDIQSFTTGSQKGYSTTRNRFQSTLVEPFKLTEVADGHFFIDFAKDAFGTLVLNLVPTSIDTIIIHLGEKLSGQNMIDRNPSGSVRYQRVLLAVKPGTNKYILDLPKDERNTSPAAIHLPDSIGVITPFRYCELENCHFGLKPADIHQKVFSYFFDDNMSSFSSSDTLLNKVWDICKYSMKATSFAGIYIDGDRERIPYEADAYINQMGHYYSDREYSLARLSNEYFIKHPTWPTEWILQTISLFYYDFMYTGNIESVRKYYEELKFKTLHALSNDNGLISSKNCTGVIMKNIGFSDKKARLMDIVDWPHSQKDTEVHPTTNDGETDGYDLVEVNTVVNAFYYQGLKFMSELAGYLGKNEDKVFYRNEALKVKKIFNEKLLDKTTGIYLDGESSHHSSLHANMMPLAFDMVPENNKETVVNFIKSRGMACSVYGAQYLLEGLYKAEGADYAFSLLTATNERSWWNMIRSGSTITMEAWDMKYKPNSDWNHAWGAAPANIIPRFMWGIVPVEPGYVKASIKPQLSNLSYSKISVPTIRGIIQAEYKLTNGEKEFSINIPANMDCDYILTDRGKNIVFLNGKRIESGIEKLNLKPGLNTIVIKKG